MNDLGLIRAFEEGRISPKDFHHVDHLRLALAYLATSSSTTEAAGRMTNALRAFACAAGQGDKYHHTLTVVWIQLVAKLLDQKLPLTYYSHGRLFSTEARERWVEPDLQAL